MPLVVERIDHVVINCTDVAVSARWYATVLGMRIETFGADRRTALRFGEQKINLRPSVVDSAQWITAEQATAGSDDLCFITAATADAVRAHLTEVGVDVVEGPVRRTGALGEMTSHYCRDPDGNLVEIAVYIEYAA